MSGEGDEIGVQHQVLSAALLQASLFELVLMEIKLEDLMLFVIFR